MAPGSRIVEAIDAVIRDTPMVTIIREGGQTCLELDQGIGFEGYEQVRVTHEGGRYLLTYSGLSTCGRSTFEGDVEIIPLELRSMQDQALSDDGGPEYDPETNDEYMAYLVMESDAETEDAAIDCLLFFATRFRQKAESCSS